ELGNEFPAVMCDESTSTEADISQEVVQIYPNPNKGDFQLDVSLIQSSEIELMIYTPLGQLVYQKRLPRTLSQVYELSTDLSPGLYLVKIQTTQSQYIRSIQVQ
ncbi:MAG: T9SS type A sorting domain-containing protein, partial [Bacteroidota bacterium]